MSLTFGNEHLCIAFECLTQFFIGTKLAAAIARRHRQTIDTNPTSPLILNDWMKKRLIKTDQNELKPEKGLRSNKEKD